MKRLGQVWIETVLYTLIGIALIGLVLSFAYPKIVKAQEKILVEQSIESMQALDEIILLVAERGADNVKSYTFTMKRGELSINTLEDKIQLIIPRLKSIYSQPDVPISDGRVDIITEENPSSNTVTLTLTYANLNITHQGQDQTLPKMFSQAPTPYAFVARNLGDINSNSTTQKHLVISIEEINDR